MVDAGVASASTPPARADQGLSSVFPVERQEAHGIDSRRDQLSAPVQVWSRRASRRADGAQPLTALHQRAFVDVGLIQMEVERVEAEAMVQHDQAPRE